MNQEEIAALFRAEEVKRRFLRHEALLRNELALQNEPLTADATKAHKKAIKQLRAYHQSLKKLTRPGYWARLWAALCNR